MNEQNPEKSKTIFSGIQPSGNFHLGNLIGAISNWVVLQDQYKCFFCIVDQHSITVRQNPAELRKCTLDLAAILLASGIDPQKSTLFIQSHVAEHSQLAWALNCFTGMGELGRMTQFKDKSKKYSDNINVGLYAYPVLQAADILLYQADLVPVGEDQKQHVELTRDIAARFNHYYSDTFNLPDVYIPKVGARVMSLQDPEKKMSKSDENDKSTIYITDSDSEIKNKIKRAVTDSGNDVKLSSDKPGISNLLTLFHIATNRSIADIENEFQGKGYGEFKSATADAVADLVRPIRERFLLIKNDKKMLEDTLKNGAENARKTAFKTVRKVYKKIGFVQF